MSLLKDLLQETGVTSAGAIAGNRGSLFDGGAVDTKQADRQKTKMLRRIGYVPVSDIIKINHSKGWAGVAEAVETASGADENFDTVDVISKMDYAEKRARIDDDTVAFGMEDENNNIIKVYVRADQADEFETALATMLAGVDSDNDDNNSGAEIAEVLLTLKDKFEIVDVDWGVIDTSEEEEMDDEQVAGDESGEGDESELDDSLDGDMDGAEVDDEADVKSTLQSVIDMMKSDAEAKQAEADAKKASAEAESAKYAADAADGKLKQEEEILDMEAHEKSKSDGDKEAKRLAKLAKYRHETQSSDSDTEVEQEESADNSTISKEDLAELILKHLASQ